METIAMALGHVYRVLTKAEGSATVTGVFRCPCCGAEVSTRFEARWGDDGASPCAPSRGNASPSNEEVGVASECLATLYCDEGLLERGGFNVGLRCVACGGRTLVKFPEGSGVAWEATA